MGLRGNVSRSALADANEGRDWRIYYEFAQSLIRIARRLYADEPIGVELTETVSWLIVVVLPAGSTAEGWPRSWRTNGDQHDAGNQLKKITDALMGETLFDYDDNGNIESLKDAEGNETIFDY